jgi:hypothetical protein
MISQFLELSTAHEQAEISTISAIIFLKNNLRQPTTVSRGGFLTGLTDGGRKDVCVRSSGQGFPWRKYTAPFRLVSWRGGPPLTGTMKSCGYFPTNDTKAISLPSGLHLTRLQDVLRKVNCRCLFQAGPQPPAGPGCRPLPGRDSLSPGRRQGLVLVHVPELKQMLLVGLARDAPIVQVRLGVFRSVLRHRRRAFLDRVSRARSGPRHTPKTPCPARNG